MTHMTLQAVRQLIANDSYAITFQSVEQYRATLLRHVDSLVDGAQQYASGGAVPAELRLVGEGLRPFPAPAAQQAAAPGALDADELTRLRRLIHALGMDGSTNASDEQVRGLLFTALGQAAGKLEFKQDEQCAYAEMAQLAADAGYPSAPGTREAATDLPPVSNRTGRGVSLLHDATIEKAAREVESAGGDSADYHANRVRALKVMAEQEGAPARPGYCRTCGALDFCTASCGADKERAAQLDGGQGQGNMS